MSSIHVDSSIPPTVQEIEKLRLILSTYQDGSGMLPASNNMTQPGWRDFERAVAAAFGGKAQESKYIFDVIIPLPEQPDVEYGISCKMRGELNRVTTRDGRITMELSNSAKKFWDYLEKKGLNKSNYRSRAAETGTGLIELVTSWHEAESNLSRGKIDLSKSFYLVLSWNKKGQYQLHQFPLTLTDPNTLTWYFPTTNRLCGNDKTGTIFEWYGESGGQLKYYPLASTAIWSSNIFQLEPLPSEDKMKYGILIRTQEYFPKQWTKACELPS